MKRSGKGQGNSKVPKEDVSILRPPISLGESGAFQVASALRTGTQEVQQVLLEECDVILECKICKNLFRGLPNLLAHKRVYCKERFFEREIYLKQLQESIRTETESETIVVQPKSPPRPPTPGPLDSDPDEDPWGNQYPDDAIQAEPKSKTGETEDKEEQGGVWDRIKQGTFVGASSSYQFYTAVSALSEIQNEGKTTSKIELEKLPGSSQAVSQRVTRLQQDRESVCSESDSASMVSMDSKASLGKRRGRKRKASLHELPDDQSEESRDDDAMVVEPEEAKGPLRMSLRERISDRGYASPLYEKLSRYADCDVKTLTCLKCNTGYSSLKTLHFHMVSLHSEKRTFYPCLYCDSTFAQLWSVTRHLMKNHRKSKAQVENMRDILRKRSYTKPVDEIGEYINPRKNPPEVAPKELKKAKTVTSTRSKAKPILKAKACTTAKPAPKERTKYICPHCTRIYYNKEAMDVHVYELHVKVELETFDEDVDETDPTQPVRSISARYDPKGSPERSRKTLVLEGVDKSDVEAMDDFIEDKTYMCFKCNRKYGRATILHRHALHHLGWARLKCKFCQFVSYTRSECKKHLRRVHSKRLPDDIDEEMSGFIVEVNVQGGGAPCKPWVNRPYLEKIAKREGIELPPLADSDSEFPQMTKRQRRDSEGSSYNISTRGRPRTRDKLSNPGTPDNLQTLRTRKGVYRKPTFAELTGRSGDPESESEDEVDKEEEQETGDKTSENSKLSDEDATKKLENEQTPIPKERPQTKEQEVVKSNVNDDKTIETSPTRSSPEVTRSSPTVSPGKLSPAQSPQKLAPQGQTVKSLNKAVTNVVSALKIATSPKATVIPTVSSSVPTRCRPIILSSKATSGAVKQLTSSSMPIRPVLVTSSQMQMIMSMAQAGKISVSPVSSSVTGTTTSSGTRGTSGPIRLPLSSASGKKLLKIPIKTGMKVSTCGPLVTGRPVMTSSSLAGVTKASTTMTSSTKPAVNAVTKGTINTLSRSDGRCDSPLKVSVSVQGQSDSVYVINENTLSSLSTSTQQNTAVDSNSPGPILAKGSPDKVGDVAEMPDLAPISVLSATNNQTTDVAEMPTLSLVGATPSNRVAIDLKASTSSILRPIVASQSSTCDIPHLEAVEASSSIDDLESSVRELPHLVAAEEEMEVGEEGDGNLHTVMTPDSLGPVDIDSSTELLSSGTVDSVNLIQDTDSVKDVSANERGDLNDVEPTLYREPTSVEGGSGVMDSPAPSPPDIGEALSTVVPLAVDSDNLPYPILEQAVPSTESPQASSARPQDILELIDEQEQGKDTEH